MAKLMLKPEPDGLGYLYGQHVADDGTVTRVDILPPHGAWRGDVKHDAIDPKFWIVYADGQEIARVARREDIDSLDITKLSPPSD